MQDSASEDLAENEGAAHQDQNGYPFEDPDDDNEIVINTDCHHT